MSIKVYPYEQESCVKCDNRGPRTEEFRAIVGHSEVGNPNHMKYHVANSAAGREYCPAEEHLHYTCARCGFVWVTQTKDADVLASSPA